MVQVDSEQSLPSALGHPGGLACQVPGRAWLRPPRTRTGRLALTSGRVACQRHPIPRHEIGSENRCRWTLRMCMASHIYEYTQQTTHRVATNTTRRPLFHRAPEDEDDRGAHSKAKEFILGISVCCLCFLKLVNLDLDLVLHSAIRLLTQRRTQRTFKRRVVRRLRSGCYKTDIPLAD